MTDYKNLKLIATSNPHIRSSETTRSIMLDVIIAMLPALVWAVISFGMKALLQKGTSIVGYIGILVLVIPAFTWVRSKLNK